MRPSVLPGRSPPTGTLFELARAFSRFYEACSVLNAEDEATQQSRLRLTALVSRQLGRGLTLLGIDVVERM